MDGGMMSMLMVMKWCIMGINGNGFVKMCIMDGYLCNGLRDSEGGLYL